MAPGILSNPLLAWPSNATSLVAATLLLSQYTSPAKRAENTLSPRDTCTDSVVIELSTTVTINHFRWLYKGPIDSFTPNYVALADGSLVNPPLLDDINEVAIKLAALSGLFTFFLINAFTATRYLYRGTVKNKTLFYLLLFSQSLGLVATMVLLVPFFDATADCRPLAIIARILIIVSYAMLMTGILGIKAYRCLNNSRFIAISLIGIRIAIFTFLGLDSSRLQSMRRLSIGCSVNPESTFLPIMVTLQFAEALFICACFMFAAWRASRRPVDHGRLSIQPTLDLKSHANSLNGVAQDQQPRRGWWDYEPPQKTLVPSSCIRSYREFVRQLPAVRRDVDDRRSKAPKSTEDPVVPPLVTVNGVGPNRSHRSSVVSRISKYMPRMTLFKKLVQDELLHTALITALLLATAVFMLIGTARKFIVQPPTWIAFNWAVASMLTMHSFDRVVRRHEQEAILQHPSAWDPLYKAEMQASRALRQDRARRAISTMPPTPTPRRLGWSDEPSVRVRSTAASMAAPSGGFTPLSQISRYTPASHISRPSSQLLHTPSVQHSADQDHSLHVSPQPSPFYDGHSSPSLWAASLGSPCFSEDHIVGHHSST